MNLSKTIFSSFLFLSVVVAAVAGEHEPGQIKGESLSLFERDHAFSGQILNRPVFGAFEHEPYGASIQIRKGDQTQVLKFSKVDREYSGTISDGTVETKVALVGIKKITATEAEIKLKIDDQDVSVKVSAKTFENGHFKSPSFAGQLGDLTLNFDFSGEACFGYSSNIALMIFGAAAHIKK
jgi:hypothetical protein